MPIPKIVITAGLMVAQVAMGMAQRTKGPRLESLKTTTADYGTPIPRFWGERRFECPIIWAESLREDKETSKGKSGGKYDEYKYYGTWAVLIADHEIDAVTKIKFDDHLVYQSKSAGPLSVAFAARSATGVKLQRDRNLRIYLGTETQDADPRMVAWCEDRYGADSCPAYRGSAYIVFEDIPLEKFGNRIPLITVEATNSKTDAFPYEQVSSGIGIGEGGQYNADYSRLMVVDENDGFNVWDVPTRQKLLTASVLDIRVEGIGVGPTGEIYAVTGFSSQTLLRIEPDGGSTLLTDDFDTFCGAAFYVGGEVCLTPHSAITNAYCYFNGLKVVRVSPGFTASHYFEDADGQAWACGGVSGQNKAGFVEVPGGTVHIVDTGVTGAAYAMDRGDGFFVAWQGSTLLLIDCSTWTVSSSASASNSSENWLAWRNIKPGVKSIWLHNREFSTDDLGLIRTINSSSWVSGTEEDFLYDPINHALISYRTGTWTWRYLDRVGNAGVTLSTVVDDVSEWCGLNDADTTALTQTIAGYSVTHGSGKDMISPLLDIHDVDARPHDFGVQFVARGSAASGTLLTEDFVREGDSARYSVSIVQDTDLPARVTVDFADINFEQQTNTVISQRPSSTVDTNREETIDLTTYAAVASDAQQLSDRRFRRIWNERERTSLSMTAMQLAMEPGDVKTLSLDGVTRTARLDRMTLQGSVLACEFVRDDPSLAVLNGASGAEIEGRDPEVIFVAAACKGFVLDIPLLDDAHDLTLPQYYFGAGPYGTGDWAGATIFETDADGDELVSWNTIGSGTKTPWGYANETLPNANPNLWDRGNSINVNLLYGTPTSATEAQIDADTELNLALIGDELIQFTTATLESDGTYTFSGFKRGRRGTEWACADHGAGETFILLSAMEREGYGLSDIGVADTFKAQSVGRDPTAATAINVTPVGNTLKPYAPCRFRASLDSGTGDWTFTWVRRTRVGGAWIGGTTIPLSETSEEYELVIPTSGTARTIVSATQTATWTSAMQTTDYGAPQTSLPANIAVYQVSDEVGRGTASAEPIAA